MELSRRNEHNVNNGTLKDVPQIHIDLFTKESVNWEINRAFFLSHAHTDHINGLFDYFLEELHRLSKVSPIFYALYMHHVTLPHLRFHMDRTQGQRKNFLKYLLDELVKDGRVILINKNQPYLLKFSLSDWWVTPLSAGHSPGSIMLKIENRESNFRIIYAADCRLNYNDLRYTSCLHRPYWMGGGPHSVDVLYVDTTFCNRSDMEFPTRKSVFDNLFEYIKHDVQNNRQYHLCMAGHLTQMYVVLRLYYKFRVPLCVSKCVHEFSEAVPELRGKTTYSEYCNQNIRKCSSLMHVKDPPMHTTACWKAPYNSYSIIFQATIPWNLEKLQDVEIWLQNCYKKIFPGIYSTHCSPNEIIRLIQYFKPKEVIALVVPKGMVEVTEAQKKLNELKRIAESTELTVPAHPEYPSFVHDFTGDKNHWISYYPAIVFDHRTAPSSSSIFY